MSFSKTPSVNPVGASRTLQSMPRPLIKNYRGDLSRLTTIRMAAVAGSKATETRGMNAPAHLAQKELQFLVH